MITKEQQFGKLKKIEAQLNYVIFKLEKLETEIFKNWLKNEAVQANLRKKKNFYDL